MCASTNSRNSTPVVAMTTFSATLVRRAARLRTNGVVAVTAHPFRSWIRPRGSTLRSISATEHLTEHVGKDPAVPVVGRLRRRVDADTRGQLAAAATRTVGVEVLWRHPTIDQVPASRRVGPYLSRGGDVVGGDRVAEVGEHPRTDHVAHRLGLARHLVEVRRTAHVG